LVSVLPLLRASLDSFRLWPEKAKKVEGKEGSEARHGDRTVPHAGLFRQVERVGAPSDEAVERVIDGGNHPL
jgi:hypothetical protein